MTILEYGASNPLLDITIMPSTNLVEVTSPEHFKELLSADLNRVSVLNFWASWAEPCEEFNKVIEQESKGFEKVLFLNVSLGT